MKGPGQHARGRSKCATRMLARKLSGQQSHASAATQQAPQADTGHGVGGRRSRRRHRAASQDHSIAIRIRARIKQRLRELAAEIREATPRSLGGEAAEASVYSYDARRARPVRSPYRFCPHPQPFICLASCVAALLVMASLARALRGTCRHPAINLAALAHRDHLQRPLAGYVTVFLLALVTDRAFLLHQPRDVRARWETIYEPRRHVAWQAERYLDYDVERNRSDFCLLDLWCDSVPGAVCAMRLVPECWHNTTRYMCANVGSYLDPTRALRLFTCLKHRMGSSPWFGRPSQLMPSFCLARGAALSCRSLNYITLIYFCTFAMCTGIRCSSSSKTHSTQRPTRCTRSTPRTRPHCTPRQRRWRSCSTMASRRVWCEL